MTLMFTSQARPGNQPAAQPTPGILWVLNAAAMTVQGIPFAPQAAAPAFPEAGLPITALMASKTATRSALTTEAATAILRQQT
jgi:hypothetical protein